MRRRLFCVLSASLVSACASQFSAREPAALNDRYSGNCTSDGKFCVSFSPSDTPLKFLMQALNSAEHKIRLAAYNFNVPELRQLIELKLSQGVEVELLLDFKHSTEADGEWSKITPKAGWKLSKYRVPVLRGRMPQMHNKIVVIDDQTVIFGSANFTYSGLISDYENLVLARETTVVKKYIDELDELRDDARLACQVFNAKADTCGTSADKTEDWDATFVNLASTGTSPAELFKPGACALLQTALLDSANLPRNGDVGACFKDAAQGAKYRKLVDNFANRERYVSADGVAAAVATRSDPPRGGLDGHRHQSGQMGKYRVFFNPEDTGEIEIVKSLHETLRDPAHSFAYISTNLVSHPDFVEELEQMSRAGVRVRLLVDKSTADDKAFKPVTDRLSPILTSVKADYAGPQTAVHNKFAVIYTPGFGTRVITGSSNWSVAAMESNDENLFVADDEELGLIYLREMLSQLLTYKYSGDENSSDFKEELTFFTRDSKLNKDCFKALLGLEGKRSCKGNEARMWTADQFEQLSTTLISVNQVPFKAGEKRGWIWVPQLRDNSGDWVELHTDPSFEGRWIGAVAVPPATRFAYKFYDGPLTLEARPNEFYLMNAEYPGSNNERTQTSSPFALQVVRDSDLIWAQH